MPGIPALSNRWLLLGGGALISAVLALAVIGRSNAGPPPQPQCEDFDPFVCISLDPGTDINTVGEDHTATATVTDGQTPIDGLDVIVMVISGPNAGELNVGVTDSNGQFSLTYTGDGGVGTDDLGALACFEFQAQIEADAQQLLCGQQIDGYIALCADNPADCLAAIGDPDGLCAEASETICDTASKEWQEPEPIPTPTPAPTAAPTATPDAAADVEALPDTGAEPPSDGGASTGLMAAAAVLALAGIAFGGYWLGAERRRAR